MRNLVLLTVISVLLFMSGGVINPVASLYARSLGADYVGIGLLGTTSAIVGVAASAFWGNMVDLLGQRKRFIVGGLLMSALTFGLVASAPDFRYLFAWNALGALAGTAHSVATLALMGDLLERGKSTRGLRMGTYRGLGSGGFGLMALFTGSIAERLSLATPYWIAGGFVLAAVLVALLLREQGPARAPFAVALRQTITTVPGRLAAPWRSLVSAVLGRGAAAGVETLAATGGPVLPPLAPLLVSALLWSLVTGAVYAVWANYMVSEVGYATSVMSRLWALASLSELPLMIVSGWLSDRVGRLTMLALGFLAWCLVFSGYIVLPVLPWILAIQLLRGFAYSAYTATAMAYATEVRGREQRGRVSGMYTAFGGLGSILGAAVGGSLTQALGFRPMFGIMAGLILAGAVYLWIMSRRYGRQTAMAQA